MDVVVQPGKVDVVKTRRNLTFAKAKLEDPHVVEELKARLGMIPIPGRHIEQTSRTFIINEAVRQVLAEVAPEEQRVAKQHWISEGTLAIIDARDTMARKLRHTGRMLSKLVDEPLRSLLQVRKEAGQDWLQARYSDGEGSEIGKAFQFAVDIRNERKPLPQHLVIWQKL